MSQTSIIFGALLILFIVTLTMNGKLSTLLGYLGLGQSTPTPSNPTGYTSPSGNLVILPVGAS